MPSGCDRLAEAKAVYREMLRVVQQATGARNAIERNIDEAEKAIAQHTVQRDRATMARTFIQEVAKATQKGLEVHIGNIVTMAMQSVFENPPEFVVRFESRRGQTECDLLFRTGTEDLRPIDSSGGGVLDVVSFALRISLWTLRKNESVFILDEPFRNVSPDLQGNVSEMVKLISKRLNLQIIMVSHAEDINQSADKTFLVSKTQGSYSMVEEGLWK